MINPTAHADAILDWMENEIGTVSREELRARIEQEVRDVARRAYDDAAQHMDSRADKMVNAGSATATTMVNIYRYEATEIRALKAGL